MKCFIQKRGLPHSRFTQEISLYNIIIEITKLGNQVFNYENYSIGAILVYFENRFSGFHVNKYFIHKKICFAAARTRIIPA